jgi:hypothetical protein
MAVFILIEEVLSILSEETSETEAITKDKHMREAMTWCSFVELS